MTWLHAYSSDDRLQSKFGNRGPAERLQKEREKGQRAYTATNVSDPFTISSYAGISQPLTLSAGMKRAAILSNFKRDALLMARVNQPTVNGVQGILSKKFVSAEYPFYNLFM